MATTLSVLIATAGDRLDLLERTLASLAECRKPSIYRETVVIENGTRHGVDKVVEKFADSLGARYLFDPLPNKSNALNTALQGMGIALILMLDDDVRLQPDMLIKYAEAAQGSDGGVFYGGPMAIDYEVDPPAWLLAHLPLSARGWQLPEGKDLGDRCFLGANWAAFADDLRQSGGFDLSRGPGAPWPGQETEMQQRMRRLGVVARYVPDALVWHYVTADRSTPQWALQRHYHRCRGKAATMTDGLAGRFKLRLRIAARRLLAMAYSVTAIGGSPNMAFQAQLRRSMAQGSRDGLKQRHADTAACTASTAKTS